MANKNIFIIWNYSKLFQWKFNNITNENAIQKNALNIYEKLNTNIIHYFLMRFFHRCQCLKKRNIEASQ